MNLNKNSDSISSPSTWPPDWTARKSNVTRKRGLIWSLREWKMVQPLSLLLLLLVLLQWQQSLSRKFLKHKPHNSIFALDHQTLGLWLAGWLALEFTDSPFDSLANHRLKVTTNYCQSTFSFGWLVCQWAGHRYFRRRFYSVTFIDWLTD